MEEKIKHLIKLYKGVASRLSEDITDDRMCAKAQTYQMVIEDLEKLLEGEKDD